MLFMYDKIETGKRIKKHRKAMGITQKELANIFHLTPKYYSEIECGYCGLSINTLVQISVFLHLSLDYIIYGIQINQNLFQSELYLNTIDSKNNL